jgi:branched-chain amino acid transport system permease protein
VNRKRVGLIALLIIILALLVLFPRGVKKTSTINLAILVLLNVTLASSWNILGGYTGQTNLGHAAFFGLGTLATRLLWMRGWSIFPSLLAGGGAAVALALLVGIPAFRLRGAYFAIGTLALGQVLYATVGNVLYGSAGLPAEYLATYTLVPRYYLCLALAALTIGTTHVLVNSRLGLGMMAVREGEDAAESLGVSALRHKILALCASAWFAGLAGGAYAYYMVSYYYQFPFAPVWSLDSVTMAYIGGTGTIIGPIIGAVFFVVVREILSLKLAELHLMVLGMSLKLGELHLMVFGILFILVVLFLPGGFVQAWKRLQRLVGRRPVSKQAGIVR